jgi:hypothetical protein
MQYTLQGLPRLPPLGLIVMAMSPHLQGRISGRFD